MLLKLGTKRSWGELDFFKEEQDSGVSKVPCFSHCVSNNSSYSCGRITEDSKNSAFLRDESLFILEELLCAQHDYEKIALTTLNKTLSGH